MLWKELSMRLWASIVRLFFSLPLREGIAAVASSSKLVFS
jgi:hypothetical protein